VRRGIESGEIGVSLRGAAVCCGLPFDQRQQTPGVTIRTARYSQYGRIVAETGETRRPG
jgi:hypothetical protein